MSISRNNNVYIDNSIICSAMVDVLDDWDGRTTQEAYLQLVRQWFQPSCRPDVRRTKSSLWGVGKSKSLLRSHFHMPPNYCTSMIKDLEGGEKVSCLGFLALAGSTVKDRQMLVSFVDWPFETVCCFKMQIIFFICTITSISSYPVAKDVDLEHWNNRKWWNLRTTYNNIIWALNMKMHTTLDGCQYCTVSVWQARIIWTAALYSESQYCFLSFPFPCFG